MSRLSWMALVVALVAATSMVWACGGDDDDDDDNDDGGVDDDDDDDDDDDIGDDDMADDDVDDDMDDDTGDDDTAPGCDPVGGELVTICDPVYPSEIEYELSVNGWPMSVNFNFEGAAIDAAYDMWFDCRPTESWPNKMNLDGFAGQTIGVIPWNLVLAYHQTPPGFTGMTDVNPTCDLVMVDADQIAVSNTLEITFTVKAGGPTK